MTLPCAFVVKGSHPQAAMQRSSMPTTWPATGVPLAVSTVNSALPRPESAIVTGGVIWPFSLSVKLAEPERRPSRERASTV